MIESFIASIRLRFKETDGLFAALDMLDCATDLVVVKNDPTFARKVRQGKLLIAKELIRRDIIFWEE